LNTSRENIEIDKEVDGRGYRRQTKGLMGGRQEAGKKVDGRGGPKEKDEGGRNRGHRG
jgi:hypothetical protein